LRSYSLCNNLSDDRMGLSLMNGLHLLQVYVSHIWHVIENSSLCTIYKSSVSPGFAKQIMSVLLILCYNGSLVTWTVISLTASKFKPHIFSVPGFALPYKIPPSESELHYDWRFTANQFVLAPSPLRFTTTVFFATEPLQS
jgi:hypothetical protein